MNNLKSSICRLLYYHFAFHLPRSTARFGIGLLCKRVRYSLCYNIFEYCGKNVNIERHATFESGTKIRIGDNSGIGIDCFIPNGSHIGNNVMMGPKCHILGRNHEFSDISIPMRLQGYQTTKPIIIEDDCWIGQNVIATPGRIIKKGSIIAAGCVLCKDFPEYSIVGGNPSKLIRSRINNK